MKSIKIILLVVNCIFIFSTVELNAQEVLFSVDTNKIFSEEFIHVYRKNNINNKNAFTRKDVDEYLTLFTNFKLRVHEAYQQKIDTISSLKKEFESYKEQLKKPYLTDHKITNELVKEAYDRYKFDIKASHILIRLSFEAGTEDTLSAYKRIQHIRTMALQGNDFAELAKQYSEDPGGKVNGGQLGYFSALQMVYPFETVAYQTLPGEISTPVRTKFGYHIIKVEDKKSSNGKVQVAHIMIRSNGNQNEKNNTETRDKIFNIFDQLKAGYDWGDVCSLYSEDASSRENEGILKPFRYGSMPPEFSEAAYSLKNIGDLSDPVQTRYGWHILKLIKHVPLESFEEMEPVIRNAIQRDERAAISREALIEKLKSENGFKENTEAIQTLLTSIENEIEIDRTLKNTSLIQVGDQQYTISDFLDFYDNNSHDKIEKLVSQFINQSILHYEESILHQKHPEYHYLLKEYQEGILLFHLMDQKIWSGASRDSIGLNNFFILNQERYKWDKRFQGTIYEALEIEDLNAIMKYINTRSSSDSNSFHADVPEGLTQKVHVEKGIFELGHHKAINNVDMGIGLHVFSIDNINYLVHIEKVIAPSYKNLNDIKGIVISDYQQFMEENWIHELNKKYIVKINKKVKKNVYKELIK